MDTVGTAATARDYERDWREVVARSIDESARSHRDTAVILERLKGQLDSHDARIKALEGNNQTAAAQRFELNSNVIGWLIAGLIAAWTLLSNHIVLR